MLTLPAASDHTDATAVSHDSDAAVVDVSMPPDLCVAAGTCPLATWVDVTPTGINLDQAQFGGDNFGVLDIVVDPARLNDIYAFTCHQGVWKSTDYGQTWTGPINTGSNGSLLNAGKQWCAAIADTGSSTSPTLWTCNGNGQTGVWKSTDGGIDWTNYQTLPSELGQDVYSITNDPYDPNHLLTGFHESKGIAESTDGGQTWMNVSGNLNPNGFSYYPFFLDTGDATTTRQTWLRCFRRRIREARWERGGRRTEASRGRRLKTWNARTAAPKYTKTEARCS